MQSPASWLFQFTLCLRFCWKVTCKRWKKPCRCMHGKYCSFRGTLFPEVTIGLQESWSYVYRIYCRGIVYTISNPIFDHLKAKNRLLREALHCPLPLFFRYSSAAQPWFTFATICVFLIWSRSTDIMHGLRHYHQSERQCELAYELTIKLVRCTRNTR